jgi:hypothetical protein
VCRCISQQPLFELTLCDPDGIFCRPCLPSRRIQRFVDLDHQVPKRCDGTSLVIMVSTVHVCIDKFIIQTASRAHTGSSNISDRHHIETQARQVPLIKF